MSAATQQQQVGMPQGISQGTLAIASLIRHHKLLKQRQGLFQSRTVDFFRYKRFVRALQSPEYKKKAEQRPDLFPPTESLEQIKLIFVDLIKSQIVVPTIKLHSNELAENDLRPNKDYPNLIISKKATLQDNEYYVWNYNPKSIWDYVMVVGIVSIILAVVCYPLWPASMRRGSYYISFAALILLSSFFVLAFVRLIVFLVSLIFVKSDGKSSRTSLGFWLFPNLFEDCGILDSFKPLYGYGEKDSYSYIKKQKRLKKKQSKKARKLEESKIEKDNAVVEDQKIKEEK